MSDWKEWLDTQVANSPMSVKEVPLDSVKGWGMREDDGNLGRPDFTFFSVVGTFIELALREVKQWMQPLIKPTGEGVVVLLKDADDNYLLQAKQEPGNPKADRHISLNSALSSSRASLNKAHGGDEPPRAEFLRQVELNELTVVYQDGGRFLEKVVHFGVLGISQADIEPAQNERWFTREELSEALKAGKVSSNLAQALAVAFV